MIIECLIRLLLTHNETERWDVILSNAAAANLSTFVNYYVLSAC